MILLLIAACVVIIVLAYLYYQARGRVLHYSQAAEQHALALDTLQKNEVTLKGQLHTLRDQLENAVKDPVTGLLGWQIFEDRLNLAIKESERYQFIMGLLVVDIDDFRMINDALGHEVGDNLLKQVSQRLHEDIRQVDSASRISKDTFIVLLNQLTKPEIAAVIAQRMLQAFEKPFILETHELYLTASIGIAIYPNDGKDSSVLMQHATEALQIAKEKDKHGFHFYQENIHINSKRELVICTGLKKDTLFDEMKLYFQPIIDTRNDSIFCIDMMPYWQSLEAALIEPQELFYYAERQHVLNNLSEWLLKVGCAQFNKWREMGLQASYLGFPVSIKQLENSRFIYRISEILQEMNVDPKSIMFTINDDAGFNAGVELEKSLNKLNYLGIKLMLTCFGASAFSLVQLKQYPVDYLKLDKYLTQDVAISNPQSTLVMKSLLLLAEGLSAELIIQDISSQAQLECFKTLNCHLMQGTYLAAPASQEEVMQKFIVEKA